MSEQGQWNPTPPETEIWKGTIPPRFVRGLQAEGPDVPQRRWDEAKQWRQTENIDTILDEPQPHYLTIKQHYQHAYYGKSVDGRIVYYERPGLSNIGALKQAGLGAREQTRHFLFITECCWRVLSPDQDSTLVTVYDMSGVGITDFGGEKLEIFKSVSKIYQSHYVERSGTICIINTGMWFRMAWKIVSPFLHPNTRAKIKILGTDYQATLDEVIGNKNLPPEYGGPSTNPSLMESPQEVLIREHVKETIAKSP